VCALCGASEQRVAEKHVPPSEPAILGNVRFSSPGSLRKDDIKSRGMVVGRVKIPKNAAGKWETSSDRGSSKSTKDVAGPDVPPVDQRI